MELTVISKNHALLGELAQDPGVQKLIRFSRDIIALPKAIPAVSISMICDSVKSVVE
jgi:hypothetical protein